LGQEAQAGLLGLATQELLVALLLLAHIVLRQVALVVVLAMELAEMALRVVLVQMVIWTSLGRPVSEHLLIIQLERGAPLFLEVERYLFLEVLLLLGIQVAHTVVEEAELQLVVQI